VRALQEALDRRGINATAESTKVSGIYHIDYEIESHDLVSVIIPTKDGYDNIERVLGSIIERTDYPNYEVVIADNGSTNPRMKDLYERFSGEFAAAGKAFRVLDIDIPFNFSKINNIAAKQAQGKYLLFLNDDTRVVSRHWMSEMVSLAQFPRVGVVGAKLSYPTHTIQHAGVVLGLGGVAGHIMAGFPSGSFGYFGRLIENVNYYALTAACCMVKTSDFQAVGGFDESFDVAYNDVDLCIRIHDQLGKDNVWACMVRLDHFESQTRGLDVADSGKMARLKEESARFYQKYAAIVDNDPYYNPNLSLTSGNFWIRKV
jgi:GT2 family glycosyltransferase